MLTSKIITILIATVIDGTAIVPVLRPLNKRF